MFFIEYAKEIMFLCIGVGFLGVSIALIRALVKFTRLVNKVDDIVNLFIEYIQKPLAMLLQAHKMFSKAKSWFSKKD